MDEMNGHHGIDSFQGEKRVETMRLNIGGCVDEVTVRMEVHRNRIAFKCKCAGKDHGGMDHWTLWLETPSSRRKPVGRRLVRLSEAPERMDNELQSLLTLTRITESC